MKGTSADGLFLEFWKLNKRRGEERLVGSCEELICMMSDG